jgi:hypothetical protein
METKKLSLEEMEAVEGGNADSVACNLAAGIVGGIWAAGISLLSFGAAIPVAILAGAAISTGLSEMAC